MNIIKRIKEFLKKKPSVEMIRASEICEEIEKKDLVSESYIPKAINIATFIYDKRYENAISLGEKLCSDNNDDYMAHCNLMVAYLKEGDIENCNKEAKLAIIKGHHTGFCENRLSMNLYKQKKYHQCIQLCNITKNERYKAFFDDVCKRAERAKKHIKDALDTKTDILFTKEEIEETYFNIEKIEKAKEWYKETRKYLKEKFNEACKKNPLNNDDALKEMKFYNDKLMELNQKYGYLQ